MTKEQKVEAATLHSAMALAFAEIDAATKKADNPFFKSKYADLPAIIGTVKPALVKHGLFFTQQCHPSDSGVIVETVLHHANGEDMSLGQLYVPANKKDPQGFGSAQTYARRYALQTAFGVPVEDDDGNAATKAVNDAKAMPAPREKLEGPHPSMSALKGAIKAFANTLDQMGDTGELGAWLGTKEVTELEKQALRYLPSWWETGEGMPAEFVPMQQRIKDKHDKLEKAETALNAVNAG